MSADDAPRIINTHDQLVAAVRAKIIPKKHALAISYTAPARHVIASGLHAWSPFFKTDPHSSAWYHNKIKHFVGLDRVQGLPEAIAWVSVTYGYEGAWVGNAMRDKVPAIVQKMFPIKRAK